VNLPPKATLDQDTLIRRHLKNGIASVTRTGCIPTVKSARAAFCLRDDRPCLPWSRVIPSWTALLLWRQADSKILQGLAPGCPLVAQGVLVAQPCRLAYELVTFSLSRSMTYNSPRALRRSGFGNLFLSKETLTTRARRVREWRGELSAPALSTHGNLKLQYLLQKVFGRDVWATVDPNSPQSVTGLQ